MAIVEQLKEKLLFRLDELIVQGERLTIIKHQVATGVDFESRSRTYRTHQSAEWSQFVEWRTSASAVLDQIVPRNSVLRPSVDGFPKLKNEISPVKFGISFLKAVKTEVKNGSLDAISAMIEGEVLSDYLTQAEGILSEAPGDRTHVPAAMLAGASLERFLRSLCLRLDPPEPIVSPKSQPLALSALIEVLRARQIYNEVQAKQLRAWAGVRNSAAHGKFEEFDRKQVELMLTGVVDFVARFGG